MSDLDTASAVDALHELQQIRDGAAGAIGRARLYLHDGDVEAAKRELDNHAEQVSAALARATNAAAQPIADAQAVEAAKNAARIVLENVALETDVPMNVEITDEGGVQAEWRTPDLVYVSVEFRPNNMTHAYLYVTDTEMARHDRFRSDQVREIIGFVIDSLRSRW